MLRSGYVRVKGGCCVVTERALTDGLRTDTPSQRLLTPRSSRAQHSTPSPSTPLPLSLHPPSPLITTSLKAKMSDYEDDRERYEETYEEDQGAYEPSQRSSHHSRRSSRSNHSDSVSSHASRRSSVSYHSAHSGDEERGARGEYVSQERPEADEGGAGGAAAM